MKVTPAPFEPPPQPPWSPSAPQHHHHHLLCPFFAILGIIPPVISPAIITCAAHPPPALSALASGQPGRIVRGAATATFRTLLILSANQSSFSQCAASAGILKRNKIRRPSGSPRKDSGAQRLSRIGKIFSSASHLDARLARHHADRVDVGQRWRHRRRSS